MNRGKYLLLLGGLMGGVLSLFTQAPPSADQRLREIAHAASALRIEADIQTLVDFGTRNTLSDTLSNTRGIGAARRWIFDEFQRISDSCGNCLELTYQRQLIPGGSPRIPDTTVIVNVLATQRGTLFPNRYVIMTGDIDSRASSSTDGITDAPGANDNASGMAGVLEAARILSSYTFPTSIIYAGLSGEEQGLYGGRLMAAIAQQEEWDILGVLNNDMIGNIEGIDGVIDNQSFRIFSEPYPVTETDRERRMRRFYGGEVDGPSRQLARYIERLTRQYCPLLNPMMIYRLDRFGRGGHHRPFNDAGYPGVRIMETHEHYQRQHQDIRVENGISYGDVLEKVDFDYAAKLTGVNALVLASLAWSPTQPQNVRIGGAVSPSTTLSWELTDDPHLWGYKVYWRETTSPQWQYHQFVGKGNTHTLKNIVIDNYYFGVSSVSKAGHESTIVFPHGLIPRN